MPNILIIGKNGNLGRELVSLYPDATAWGRSELDVTDENAVTNQITGLKPDIVFNCTAYNDVDGAEQNSETAKSINAKAPEFLAKVCDQISATLVHYSTGQVFAGDSKDGYTETDIPQPINAYGQSKLGGEQAVTNFCKKSYIIRTEWLYAKPATTGTSKKSFIDIMLEMAETGKSIKAVDDEFGKPTYAKDLAIMSKELVEQNQPFGIYHGINEGLASRYDWAKEIFRIKNIEADLSPVPASTFPPREAKRPQYEILNNTKFPKLRSWQDALKDYLTND